MSDSQVAIFPLFLQAPVRQRIVLVQEQTTIFPQNTIPVATRGREIFVVPEVAIHVNEVELSFFEVCQALRVVDDKAHVQPERRGILLRLLDGDRTEIAGCNSGPHVCQGKRLTRIPSATQLQRIQARYIAEEFVLRIGECRSSIAEFVTPVQFFLPFGGQITVALIPGRPTHFEMLFFAVFWSHFGDPPA